MRDVEAWPLPWRAAMERALYGPDGFYHRPAEGPGAHFRTSSTASPHFARALLRLATAVDDSIGRPAHFDLVEVAAARGVLLSTLARLAPYDAPDLAHRLRLVGVDLAGRPPGLPETVGWAGSLAELPPVTGLLVANEWLDNVPLDVVEQTPDGPRLVLVDRDGSEALDGPPSGADLAWLGRWWPGLAEGDRAEVGAPRDRGWAEAVRRVERGVAVAVDYGHLLAERSAGAFSTGTLTGYRGGRQVAPVPSGDCDITAHVALDAVAAAGAAAGADDTLLTTQRSVLRGLGVRGQPPPPEAVAADPAGYLRSLAAAGEEAELIAADGLGGFGWVVHAVGVPLPEALGGDAG